MKTSLAVLLALNALLFFFGAYQHAGGAIGPLHEPRIVPAAIVESLCGLFLTGGAFALIAGWRKARRFAVIANFVALAGVLLGMAALALGAGPRTASNDLYHRIMLALIAGSLFLLFLRRRAARQT